MQHYINKKIYFNTVVSQYFNVPFYNNGVSESFIASTILNCSVVSWDIDTRKVLVLLGDSHVTLLGKGSGTWEIYATPEQQKPDTDSWNNPLEEDDDPQRDNGRNESRILDSFLKDNMFI